MGNDELCLLSNLVYTNFGHLTLFLITCHGDKIVTDFEDVKTYHPSINK